MEACSGAHHWAIHTVQELLGHAEVATTMIYAPCCDWVVVRCGVRLTHCLPADRPKAGIDEFPLRPGPAAGESCADPPRVFATCYGVPPVPP